MTKVDVLILTYAKLVFSVPYWYVVGWLSYSLTSNDSGIKALLFCSPIFFYTLLAKSQFVCSKPMKESSWRIVIKKEIFFKTKTGNSALHFHSHFTGQNSIIWLLMIIKEIGKHGLMLRKKKKQVCGTVTVCLRRHILYWSRSS